MDLKTMSVPTERGMNLRTGTYRAKNNYELRSLQEVSTETFEFEKLSRKLSRRTWHGMEGSAPTVRPLPIYEEITEVTTQDVFYKSKSFPHFHYTYDLTRDCASRVEMISKSFVQDTQMPESIRIKIRYSGDVTKENLRLVTKWKGKVNVHNDKHVWEASPLVCFQSRIPLSSAWECLLSEKACCKIFVTSNSSLPCEEEEELKKGGIVIVNKDQVQAAITSCLEKPLHRNLDGWIRKLISTTDSAIIRIRSEIENIRKQLTFEESKETPLTCLKHFENENIVPCNIKEFLFSKDNVNAFGLWQNEVFKVFVKTGTDEQNLCDEIQSMNEDFFKKYTLEIESKLFVETLTMKQGDYILPTLPDKDGKFSAGTLGGFVTKSNDPKSKYAVTCNHIFPVEGVTAYDNDNNNELQRFREIGKCIFTTRERQCDFAAIEIDESVSNDCDITFRRDDEKEINARVYDDSLDNLGIVHKIGAESGVTNGTILSHEFYVNCLLDNDQHSVFLVQGTRGHFSREGDSGSLVFSRPRQLKQNYVNVVGMVFGNNALVDDGSIACGQECSFESETSEKKSLQSQDAYGKGEDRMVKAVDIAPEHISSCYRIHPALDLFEQFKGVHVKFKDDLSSSQSAGSESDDSV